VFAAGGPLDREPHLDEPAVLELARDLDDPSRRSALATGLTGLELTAPVIRLLNDPELAWIAFACALLAEELGEDDSADA